MEKVKTCVALTVECLMHMVLVFVFVGVPLGILSKAMMSIEFLDTMNELHYEQLKECENNAKR